MNKSKYNNWELFLSDLLKAKKAKDESIDLWLRSIELAFGPTIFATIARAVGASVTSTTLATDITAGLGALLGPFGLSGVAAVSALLLKQQKEKESEEIVVKLKMGKIVYDEILSSEMNYEEKNEAIDELFEDLLENRQIIY